MFILIVPWLLLLLLFVSLILLCRKKWKWGLLLIVLGVVVNVYTECIPLRLCSVNKSSKGKVISVMCFNIEGMTGDIKQKAPLIANLINSITPDIIYLTEYCEQDVLALDTLLERYLYSTKDLHNEGSYFYSMFPISTTSRLINEDGSVIFGVYKNDVYVGNDTISIYGCHLSSNNYDLEQTRVAPDSINGYMDVINYIRNVGYACKLRTKESEAVAEDIIQSFKKAILMGDLNDISGSTPLRTLEYSGLKDAWWEGGVGYGATIHNPFPYRIDHIMFTPGLNILNIKKLDAAGASDHDALYAVFEY